MAKYKVLLTDYAWPDVEMERQILAAIDAELIVAPEQDVETLAELAGDVDAIMTCWANVPQVVVAAAGKCRMVSRMGIGLDNIDVDYCTQAGIPVTNVPDYCATEVAEHALGLIFALARRIAFFHHQTKNGRYDLNAVPMPSRLAGQTLGIIGLGRIGTLLANKALALEMTVLAARHHPQGGPEGVTIVAVDELLQRSDHVSLHLPLNAETHHLIDERSLTLMKPAACLINTARGGLVDQQALAQALDNGRLAAAALDVQDPEPPDLSLPPFNHPCVIVTPHAAFVSRESLAELRRRAAGQVAARLSGQVPEHVVNPSVL